MDAKVPELLNLTRKLLNRSVKIVNDSLPLIESVEAKEVRYSIFLRVQMSEALKFGYGAYYSCYHGWGHGGIGAARSIYEILLDMKYINHGEAHRDARFTRFLDHGAEWLYRDMERKRSLGGQVCQKEQNELTEAYNQLKKKYKDKHDQSLKSGVARADATPEYRRYNWAGLDLSEKVKEVNLEQFHQLYKELSALSHVSIYATLASITEYTESQIEVDLSLHSSCRYCYKVLDVTFTCLFGILEEYMKYFRICYSNYPDLENLGKNYKELLNR